MRDRICIILLHTGQLEETRDTLASLSKIDYKLFTPLVVLQPSIPEVVSALRAAFPRVPLFQNQEDLGVAGGNNTAIEWALKKPFKWILLLNNPAQVPTDLLKRLMIVAQENPVVKLFKTPNRAALLIHRDVFKTIGLFDPRFFFFWDKTDFFCRAKRKGFVSQTVVLESLHISPIALRLKHDPIKYYYWWGGYLLWAKRNYPAAIRKQIVRQKLFQLVRTYLSLPFLGKEVRAKQLPCLHAALKGVLHYCFKKYL